jgi:hypothetical protein
MWSRHYAVQGARATLFPARIEAQLRPEFLEQQLRDLTAAGTNR